MVLMLKEFRKKKNLTQVQMAEQLTSCGHKCYPGNLGGMENGKRVINFEFIIAFARCFPNELDGVIFNSTGKLTAHRIKTRTDIAEGDKIDGNWLLVFRREHNLTQKGLCAELLKKVGYKTCYQYIQKIETGTKVPSMGLLEAIKSTYKINVEQLLESEIKKASEEK